MGLFQYASGEIGSGNNNANENVFFEASVLASRLG
jgi:hypothetical protein